MVPSETVMVLGAYVKTYRAFAKLILTGRETEDEVQAKVKGEALPVWIDKKDIAEALGEWT